jgi:hypothetical protein
MQNNFVKLFLRRLFLKMDSGKYRLSYKTIVIAAQKAFGLACVLNSINDLKVV